MPSNNNGGTLEAFQREQRELQEKYAGKMQEDYEAKLSQAREQIAELNNLGDSIAEITGEPHAPLMVARRQNAGGGGNGSGAGGAGGGATRPRSRRMDAGERESLAGDIVKAINDRDKGQGLRSADLKDLYDRKQPSLRSFLNDNGQREGKGYKVKGEKAAQRFHAAK